MGTTEISVPAAGSSLPLNFTANTSWTVSSDQDWVSFDRMSGDAGEVTVTMTVEANPDYEDRTATVTIKAGTKTTLFKVVQRMLETFSAEFVYEVGPEEQIIEFALESNKEYVFSIDKDCAWISFAPSQSSAPESSVMKFRISELTELKPREGRIVAKVDDVAYALIVKQKGAYDYMTSATATYYGRTMRMYDDENGYYHYDEYVVELTNEEGVTVHLAVNADAFAEVHQMRRGVQPDPVTGLLQHGGQHVRHGAFAVGSGNVDGLVRLLRIAQCVEQADGVGQSRLVGLPADVVVHRLAVV